MHVTAPLWDTCHASMVRALMSRSESPSFDAFAARDFLKQTPTRSGRGAPTARRRRSARTVAPVDGAMISAAGKLPCTAAGDGCARRAHTRARLSTGALNCSLCSCFSTLFRTRSWVYNRGILSATIRAYGCICRSVILGHIYFGRLFRYSTELEFVTSVESR